MADPVFVDDVTPLNAVNLNKLQTRDEKAAANGYPSLDSGGKVPVAQLPAVGAALSYDGDWVAGTYQDGQVVVKDGIAYLCVGGPTTAAPDSAPWGLASAASYGTTLPASPVDGQEAILVDSLTAPTYVWRFRYNAGSTSPYKWEFIGGGSALYLDPSTVTVTGTTLGGGISHGPFTAPRAGIYRVAMGLQGYRNEAGYIFATLTLGGAQAGSYIYVYSTGLVAWGETNYLAQLITVAAGQLPIMVLYLDVAGTGTVQSRLLEVTPVRVS